MGGERGTFMEPISKVSAGMKGMVFPVGLDHFVPILERGNGIIRRLMVSAMDDGRSGERGVQVVCEAIGLRTGLTVTVIQIGIVSKVTLSTPKVVARSEDLGVVVTINT